MKNRKPQIWVKKPHIEPTYIITNTSKMQYYETYKFGRVGQGRIKWYYIPENENKPTSKGNIRLISPSEERILYEFFKYIKL